MSVGNLKHHFTVNAPNNDPIKDAEALIIAGVTLDDIFEAGKVFSEIRDEIIKGELYGDKSRSFD